MKNKRITETDIDNIITESFLYKRLRLLAVNRFKYGGLEDLLIEERHVEKFLFDEGKCFWFNDPNYGVMCLPCQGVGVNVLNDPTRWRVTGFGYVKEIKANDGVLMENNKLRMPTSEIVSYFVKQMYEVIRTRDVNVKTLKLPFIIATDDKRELTAKKILEMINDNTYAVVVNKNSLNLDDFIKVLNTGAKSFTTDLTDLYHDILNEALTYLGINNANTDKKERLITDEANANNQLIESCSEMFLESRRRAVDEINKKFGTNITVELRTTDEGGNGYEIKPIQELTT
ncbi:MAG: hypothetical protein J6R88_01485 [Clostridia bacterium]|nr:hypothetical protein [Clostridia bacterium]